MTAPQNEIDLVSRAKRGDRQAADELFALHGSRLQAVVRSLIWDRDEVESLVQETITRALAELDRFQEGAPFSPWLNGIGLNVCRNALRKGARQAPGCDPEILQQAVARNGARQGVLSEIFSREQGVELLRAIEELPIPLREAFVLHYVEGIEYAEIAQMSGVAEGTLRVRALRARALLRDRLGSVVDTWMREA